MPVTPVMQLLTTTTAASDSVSGWSSKSSSTATVIAGYDIDSKSGVKTLNYEKIIAEGGELPMNPYSRQITAYINGFGSENTYQTTQTFGYQPGNPNRVYGTATSVNTKSGQFGSSGNVSIRMDTLAKPPVDSKRITTAEQLAIADLLEKLKDQKADLQTLLATYKQTADMFSATAKTFITAARAVRRGDIGSFAKAFGIAPKPGTRTVGKYGAQNAKLSANALLQYRYGWSPLLQDLEGSCQKLSQMIYGDRPIVIRAVGSSTSKSSVHKVQTVPTVGGRSELITTYSDLVTVKYHIRATVSNSFLRDFAQVGVGNVAVTAWELVPWSFAVDRLIDIGGWLSTIDATVGLSFVSGCKSTVKKRSMVAAKTYTQVTAQTVWPYQRTSYTGSSKGSWREDSFSRVTLEGFPRLWLPNLGEGLNLRQLQNGLALLIQLRR